MSIPQVKSYEILYFIDSFVLLGDNCTGDEFRLKSCIKQNIDIIQDCLSTVHVQCFGM